MQIARPRVGSCILQQIARRRFSRGRATLRERDGGARRIVERASEMQVRSLRRRGRTDEVDHRKLHMRDARHPD